MIRYQIQAKVLKSTYPHILGMQRPRRRGWEDQGGFRRLCSESFALKLEIPSPVLEIVNELHHHGYQAFIVGGAVRDIQLGQRPKDWDIATDALPEDVESIFGERAIPTGERFGTITVVFHRGEKAGSGQAKGADYLEEDGHAAEVTTFRSDGIYSDGRRPDSVSFSSSIEEDLARRDFTINALAYDPFRHEIVDPFNGMRDLRERRISCVGKPEARFKEDALRMLRAVRLAAELSFEICPDTKHAILSMAHSITKISKERIRAELDRMLVSPDVKRGLDLLQGTGLLGHIIPELQQTVGMEQGSNHIHTVWRHTMDAVCRIEPALALRLAALLHDVGKPATLSRDEQGRIWFHHHDIVGAEIAASIMRRLGYPSDLITHVSSLIKYHMFRFNTEATDGDIRRLVAQLGLDFIYDLAKLREADREATGTMHGMGENMTLLLHRIREALARGPILHLKDLAIDGSDIMDILNIPPGPKVGAILHRLLDMVMDDPSLNTKEKLLELARELNNH